MSKLKKPVDNSTKLEEFEHTKQTETPTEPVKLVDNTTEEPKDIDEITQKTEEKAEDEKTIAVVCYIGSGSWKDSNGEMWANTNKSKNILSERKYTIDEYEGREDLKFMVGYGSMKVIFV